MTAIVPILLITFFKRHSWRNSPDNGAVGQFFFLGRAQ